MGQGVKSSACINYSNPAYNLAIHSSSLVPNRTLYDRGIAPVNDVEISTSRIAGLGLFAARPFCTGQRIRQINVVREVTPASPLREELGERADHCDYPNGKIVLLGPPDRHVNHSCDPNAYVLYEGDRSFLVARRDLAVDEEITVDYNINITGGTAWPCHCGATRCRGTVVGDFFLLPLDIQREYQPLLAEWFVRTHRDRLIALGLPTI
jgi:hypothetical protein